MSLAGLTIFLDRLSTTKTETVLFFWSCLTSSKLNIRPCSCISLEMAFARWSKSSTSTCIFGGAVQLFSFFSTTFSFSFLSGEGCFLGGDFSFFCVWSVGGAFLSHGDSPFFFTWGGGSPLLGEKRAFLAEPSARPAINGRLDEGWGMNKMRIKKTKTTKKNGRKRAYLCVSTRSEDFSPVGRSRHDEENGKSPYGCNENVFFFKETVKNLDQKRLARRRDYLLYFLKKWENTNMAQGLKMGGGKAGQHYPNL